jgi:hypothetical protein
MMIPGGAAVRVQRWHLEVVLPAGVEASRLTALRTAGVAAVLALPVARPCSLRVLVRELPRLVACGVRGLGRLTAAFGRSVRVQVSAKLASLGLEADRAKDRAIARSAA